MEENNTKQELSKFKKYLICLKKSWLMILILSIIGILLGLVIASKTYHKKYEENNYSVLNFRYKEEVSIDYNDIISTDNIERCKKITKSLETGKKVSTYKYVDIKNIKIEKNNMIYESLNTTYYTIFANMEAFNVSSDYSYSDAAAKGFLKHLTLLIFLTDEEIEEYTNDAEKLQNEVFLKFDKEFYTSNSLDSDGKLITLISNPNATKLNKEDKIIYHTIWISSSFLVMFIISLIFIFIFVDKLEMNVKREYDNILIYRTPFHKTFFTNSLKVFSDLKSLVLMALLLALVMVCKFIPIPSGFGELGLGFGYLFLSISCMLFGPFPALVIGALSDIIGYLIRPDGLFFIGYTFQAMFACFVYALCFHKTYLTFTRCLIARVLVNFVANVIIGTICRSIMLGLSFEASITYLLVTSLPKNVIYLLPQSVLLFFVMKAVSMPLYYMKLIDRRIAYNFSFF